jgi:hypothetical protein
MDSINRYSPVRLTDKLATVISQTAYGNHPPTKASIAVRDELVVAIDRELKKLEHLVTEDLAAFNDQAARLNLSAVATEPM